MAVQEVGISADIHSLYPKPRRPPSSRSRSERLLASNSQFQVHPVLPLPVPLLQTAQQGLMRKLPKASRPSHPLQVSVFVQAQAIEASLAMVGARAWLWAVVAVCPKVVALAASNSLPPMRQTMLVQILLAINLTSNAEAVRAMAEPPLGTLTLTGDSRITANLRARSSLWATFPRLRILMPMCSSLVTG